MLFPQKAEHMTLRSLWSAYLASFPSGNGLDESVCQIHDEAMTALLTIPAKAAPLTSYHEHPPQWVTFLNRNYFATHDESLNTHGSPHQVATLDD